jgi:hypothetical protein
MRKKGNSRRKLINRDTMRPEYDFSQAVRGVTAARYAQGANVVVVRNRRGARLGVLAGVMRTRAEGRP